MNDAEAGQAAQGTVSSHPPQMGDQQAGSPTSVPTGPTEEGTGATRSQASPTPETTASSSSAAERVKKLPPPKPGPPRRHATRPLPQRQRTTIGESENEASSPSPVVSEAPRSARQGPFRGTTSPPTTPLNRRELDALIEAELQAALAGVDLEKSLSAPASTQAGSSSVSTEASFKPGQRIEGRIVAIHGRDVFVDIPSERSQGVLPLEQFEGQVPRLGETVLCRLESYDSTQGLWQLSRQGAAQQVSDWSQLQPHMMVEARVVGINKQRSGLLVEVAGIRGFLPASQIDLHRVEDLDAWVNQRLKVEIIEVRPAERNLVVSRRAVLERERQQQAEQFWSQIQEGQILRGTVRAIRPFGAFIDLGGADGLLPASELAWQRVEKIEDVLRIGQEVEVAVVRLDREQRKLTLSLKRLTTDPWAEFASTIRPGTVLSGVVTRLTDFGAFVEVAPGIEGLVHISELAPHRVRRASEVVQPGQQINVEVLTIEPEHRRLSLSMRSIAQRQAEATAAAQAEEERVNLQEAMERLAQRKPSRPGLRGGIGSEPLPPLE
jgi:small subunit ribosomal protein S1